jgi:hypothetical protein
MLRSRLRGMMQEIESLPLENGNTSNLLQRLKN